MTNSLENVTGDTVSVTQGDTPTLEFVAAVDGVPVDLTGAVFTTSVLVEDGETLTFPDGQHTAAPDQATNPGEFSLELTADDTNAIPVGTNKEVITKVVIGSVTVHYVGQNLLDVLSATPVR